MRLTDAEFAVLEPLWQHGPQTIRQLTARLYPGESVSDYATVQKLLERLEAKGCVRRDRSGLAHVFHAAVERAALIDDQLQDIADRLCAGSLLPVGGAKGYGLAVMLDVLAGVLTGARFGAGLGMPGAGQFFLAELMFGGAIIRAGDIVIDGSVRGHLDRLANTLSV